MSLENSLGSESFLQISQSCLVHILKGNAITAKEDFIYERCIAWAKAMCKEDENETPDGEAIRKVLGEAFYYIRIPTMNLETLFNCTTGRNPYTLSEYEKVVEKIYGHDVSLSSNSCTKRGTLAEKISRKEIRGYDNIGCNTESSVDVFLKRGCILRSLKLIPVTSTFVGEKEFVKLLQLMKFIIQIPELSFERMVPMINETVWLHLPLSMSSESSRYSIRVEAEHCAVTSIINAVHAHSNTACCWKSTSRKAPQLIASASDKEEKVTSHIGEVIFKTAS